MREVEVKLYLGSVSASESLQRLKSCGYDFGSSALQTDYVFARRASDLLHPKPGTVIARIRDDENQLRLTVKRRLGRDLDRLEEEVGILDEYAGRRILELLGLSELVVVRKQRWHASVDSVNVELDEVSGLGTFLELEYLSNSDGDDHGARRALTRELDRITSCLGATFPVVEEGYDRMLMEARRT